MLAKADPIEPAPYRSVRHALRSAFALECRDIVKSPSLYMSRMSVSDLTPYDRAAEASMIIHALHANCRLEVIRAVTAQYMAGELRSARGTLMTQADAIDSMVWHVVSYPHLSGYPKPYLRDVVCLWADAPQSRSEPDWISELGKSSRQLQRIKFGNRERGTPGVCQILDDLLSEADDVLGEVFSRRGVI